MSFFSTHLKMYIAQICHIDITYSLEIKNKIKYNDLVASFYLNSIVIISSKILLAHYDDFINGAA